MLRLVIRIPSPRAIAELALIAFFSFVPIRIFLLGSGFYDYSDQAWPFLPGILAPGVFGVGLESNSYVYFAQLLRDALTWPYYAIFVSVRDPLLAEKIFYIYAFALYTSFAVILARVLGRSLKRVAGWNPSVLQEILFEIVVVVFAVVNLTAEDLLVDGGSFTDGLIVIFIAIACSLLLFEFNQRRAVTISAVLLSVSLFLDADYFGLFAMAIILTILARGVSETRVRAALISVADLVVKTAPIALFVLVGYNLTLVTTGPFANLRAISVNGIQVASRNLSLSSVFTLTGRDWSTIAYGPPTLIGVGSGLRSVAYLGFPAQVLLPAGGLTEVWVASMFLPFGLAVAALCSKRLSRSLAPLGAVLLAAIAWTQVSSTPSVAGFLVRLGQAPYLGPPLGTMLAFPDHALQVVTACFLVLVPIGTLSLAGLAQSIRERLTHTFIRVSRFRRARGRSGHVQERVVSTSFSRRRAAPNTRSSTLSTVVTIAVVGLFLFTGWQSLSGDYALSRAYPPYVPGNGVPSSAPFTPVEIPPSVESIYSYLRTYGQDGNSYWPTDGIPLARYGYAQALFNPSDPPTSMVGVPALPYLISQNLTGSLAGYLQANDVKFVVVQDAPPLILQQVYGLSNYTEITSELASSIAFHEVMSGPGISLWELLPPASAIYTSNILLTPTTKSYDYATAYSAFAAMGLQPAIAYHFAGSLALGVNNFSNPIALSDPGTIANLSFVQPISTNGVKVSTYQTSPSTNSINESSLPMTFSTSQPVGSTQLGEWTATNWGPGPVELNVTSGMINWITQSATTVSFSFNGSMSQGIPGGVEVVDPGYWPLEARIAFQYELSGPTSQLDVYDLEENRSLALSGGPTTTLPPTSSWVNVSTERLVPGGTKFFDIRIQANSLNGSFSLRAVTLDWNIPVLSTNITQGEGDLQFQNWTLTNWGPSDFNTSWQGNNVTWASSTTYPAMSLSYNGSLTGGSAGGVAVPQPNLTAITLQVGLKFRTSPNFTGAIYLGAIALNAASRPYLGVQVPINTSTVWQSVSTDFALPPGVAYFTPRLEVEGFAGTIEFRNLSFAWNELRSGAMYPFGDVMKLGARASLTLPPYRTNYLEVQGAGSIGGTYVNSPSEPAWLSVVGNSHPSTAGELDLLSVISTNSTSISMLESDSVVYARSYYPGIILHSGSSVEASIPSIDGLNIFPGERVTSGAYVTIGAQSFILWGYALSLCWLVVLLGSAAFWKGPPWDRTILNWVRSRTRRRLPRDN